MRLMFSTSELMAFIFPRTNPATESAAGQPVAQRPGAPRPRHAGANAKDRLFGRFGSFALCGRVHVARGKIGVGEGMG